MSFEQIVAIISLAISALSIIFSFLNARLQLNFELKKEKRALKKRDKEICYEFVAYCKKANWIGLTKDEKKKIDELYIEMYKITDNELREVLVSCLSQISTNEKISSEQFSKCINFLDEYFKKII